MNIEKFQKIIKETYYTKDNTRGLWNTFGWFISEVGELSKDMRKKDKKTLGNELGDVFAWLVSIANILEIDVSEALQKYAKGCPKCKSIPCKCP